MCAEFKVGESKKGGASQNTSVLYGGGVGVRNMMREVFGHPFNVLDKVSLGCDVESSRGAASEVIFPSDKVRGAAFEAIVEYVG